MCITGQTAAGRAPSMRGRCRREQMRSIHLFLAGYFILIVGVGLALWQTGVLNHVGPVWIGIGAIIAVGLGIMLSVLSGKPAVVEEFQK